MIRRCRPIIRSEGWGNSLPRSFWAAWMNSESWAKHYSCGYWNFAVIGIW